MKKIITLTIILMSVFTVFAQKKLPSNRNLQKFQEGQVLIYNETTKKVELSKQPYDPRIIGVYKPAEKIPLGDTEGFYIKEAKILDKGIAYVKYNSENGQIRAGDLLTSSSVPGEAMKATDSGLILGIALENAITASGLIKVRILIQYVR